MQKQGPAAKQLALQKSVPHGRIARLRPNAFQEAGLKPEHVGLRQPGPRPDPLGFQKMGDINTPQLNAIPKPIRAPEDLPLRQPREIAKAKIEEPEKTKEMKILGNF